YCDESHDGGHRPCRSVLRLRAPSVHDIAELTVGVGGDFFSGRLYLLLVPSHQPRMPFLVGGARQSPLIEGIQSFDRLAPIVDQRDCGYVDAVDSARALGIPA